LGGLAVGLSDLEQGPIMKFCEHGNELCDSRKDEKFVDQKIDFIILKSGSDHIICLANFSPMSLALQFCEHKNSQTEFSRAVINNSATLTEIYFIGITHKLR
jgi:hypothetical protein